MSTSTIDYSDPNIDAGGDNAYDSSNYGTTTGNLNESAKPDQGDFGSGKETGPKASTGGPGLRANNQDVVNNEQWGESSGQAGQLGGESGKASVAPAGEGMSAEDKKTAQGYSKTNNMNPEIGA